MGTYPNELFKAGFKLIIFLGELTSACPRGKIEPIYYNLIVKKPALVFFIPIKTLIFRFISLLILD